MRTHVLLLDKHLMHTFDYCKALYLSMSGGWGIQSNKFSTIQFNIIYAYCCQVISTTDVFRSKCCMRPFTSWLHHLVSAIHRSVWNSFCLLCMCFHVCSECTVARICLQFSLCSHHRNKAWRLREKAAMCLHREKTSFRHLTQNSIHQQTFCLIYYSPGRQ